jgi:hypothetical protein
VWRTGDVEEEDTLRVGVPLCGLFDGFINGLVDDFPVGVIKAGDQACSSVAGALIWVEGAGF